MYDIIVVGARLSGAAFALEMARKGHKVLVLDRMKRGQDTLSTHFMWPRGASYLNRLGVLDEILAKTPSANRIHFKIEDFAFSGEIPLDLLQARHERVHQNTCKAQLQTRYFSARRRFLDTLLLEKAEASGVEVRLETQVENLIVEGGRPVGVSIRRETGGHEEIRGSLVIGADGKRSLMASQLGVKETEPRKGCTFACYSYFTDTGLPIETSIQKRGRLSLAHCATNDGAHMILVFGPESFYSAFSEAKEENFYKALHLVNPDIAERVRAGRRVESFYSTADQAGFVRKASGPGFALLGDAACFKDQCTAIGMTHALRDAALLAGLLSADLNDHERVDSQLALYQQKRVADSSRYYDFVCTQAEMNAARPDELELFEALQESPAAANRFVALYGDTLPVREFFAEREQRKMLRPLLLKPRTTRRILHQTVFTNPFISSSAADADDRERFALARNAVEFSTLPGCNLLERVEDYQHWYAARQETETFQYSRTLEAFPGPRTRLVDDAGRSVEGINFASQDYLAMGQHPVVREAAVKALHDFGPHSAGSPMIIGNTAISRALEQQLSQMLQMEHVVLFPTGWAAGYGSIVSLVRPQDYVVMDRLSHSCLQQGAYAATKNIYKFPHLDVDTAGALLRDIRSRDVRNGIMLVTEGIFSMDADSPNIRAFQQICRENNATLLIDIAHDFGATGPQGSGQLGIQNMLGEADIVMGSFSKSFASNGGFLATKSAAVKNYVKMYSSSHLFSNALSPVQSAVALAAAQIMTTVEGDQLREAMLNVSITLRREFAKYELECRGTPGPIVPVMIGEERCARICHRLLQQRHIAAMIIEYPLVAVGAARFRLQVMASHTTDDAVTAAQVIAKAIQEAKSYKV